MSSLIKTLTKFALVSTGIVAFTSFGHVMRCDMHDKQMNERSNHHTVGIIGDKFINYRLEHDHNQHPYNNNNNITTNNNNNGNGNDIHYLVVYINEIGHLRPVIPMPFQLIPFSKWLSSHHSQQRNMNNNNSNDNNNNHVMVHMLEYDRLGTGFSNEIDTPRHAMNSAYELCSLLDQLLLSSSSNASLSSSSSSVVNMNSKNTRIILVTEGYGSLIGRLFASQFASSPSSSHTSMKKRYDVAGVICLDALVEKSLEDDSFRKQVNKQMQQAQMMQLLSRFGLVEWLNLIQSSHLSHRTSDWSTFLQERKHLIRSCKQVYEATTTATTQSADSSTIPILFLNQKPQEQVPVTQVPSSSLSLSSSSSTDTTTATTTDTASTAVSTSEQQEQDQQQFMTPSQKVSRYMQLLAERTGHPLSQYREVPLDEPAVRQNEVCHAINQFILHDLKSLNTASA